MALCNAPFNAPSLASSAFVISNRMVLRRLTLRPKWIPFGFSSESESPVQDEEFEVATFGSGWSVVFKCI